MYEKAFEARDDLKQFGDNALLLFALILKFGYDDITTIAAESLTDGFNDKKADLILVDQDSGHAIIAQGYCSKTYKDEAPANKADDLNTAVSWILTQPIKELPLQIQSASQQLRAAIENKQIKTIEVWYVHNLPESKHCNDELKIVEHTLSSIVKDHFAKYDLSVSAMEVGKNKIDEWYKMSQSPILVNKAITFKIPGGFQIQNKDWEAYSTVIQLKDLYKLFNTYGKNIFSANIRDYLGTRKSDSNINNGIRKTAINNPKNFCVYNNGITAITHSYSLKGKKLEIHGISIVNGAQTTGSIGNLRKEPDEEAFVLCRFIKCDSKEIISNIVRFNNSQNKITAMDFRSNDNIQERLRKEFSNIGDNEYLGGRRGGIDDAIKRKTNLIPSDTVAQTLAAFHGDPNIAYNQKSDIWNKDELYSKYFTDVTSAEHILFNSIKALKLNLFEKLKNGDEMLIAEETKLKFLRMRGANYILISAIASCLEIILNRKIPNLFRVSFEDSVKLGEAQKLWDKIVTLSIPFSTTLEKVTKKSLGVTAENTEAINVFKSLVESTSMSNKLVLDEFAKKVCIK